MDLREPFFILQLIFITYTKAKLGDHVCEYIYRKRDDFESLFFSTIYLVTKEKLTWKNHNEATLQGDIFKDIIDTKMQFAEEASWKSTIKIIEDRWTVSSANLALV